MNPWSTVEVAIRALPQKRFAFCRVLGSGPDCTASFGLQWVSFETRKKVTASRRDITGSPDIYTERRSAMNAEISVTEVVEIFAGDYLRRYDL